MEVSNNKEKKIEEERSEKKKTARTKITIQRAGEGSKTKAMREGERKNARQSSEQPACYQHLNHS